MKILCVGELLIDFISEDGKNFQKKPGGAPANVAVAISRLDGEVSMAASVGDDFLGDFLIEKMKKEGVGAENIIKRDRNTTLAMVDLENPDDPGFNFYRGSDQVISSKQLEKSFEIVHFGSLPLSNQDSFENIIDFLTDFKGTVSFDPNLREDLMSDKFMERVESLISETDILFVSGEEAEKLGGKKFLENSVDELVVSKGSEGAEVIKNGKKIFESAKKVDVVDTTGAGDSLAGTYLKYTLDNLKAKEKLEKSVKASSYTVKSKGAMTALPTEEQLN